MHNSQEVKVYVDARLRGEPSVPNLYYIALSLPKSALKLDDQAFVVAVRKALTVSLSMGIPLVLFRHGIHGMDPRKTADIGISVSSIDEVRLFPRWHTCPEGTGANDNGR